MRVRKALSVGLIAVLVLAGCSSVASERRGSGGGYPRPLPPSTQVRTVLVHDQPRTYRLHLPAESSTGLAPPLVLALHGKASSGEEMEQAYGMSEAGDSRGVGVAYLEGARQGWGVNTYPTPIRPDPEADIDFARAVIDELVAAGQVDPARVYVVGLSSGGTMALRLAAEHPDWFAAAASVAGQLPAPAGQVVPTGPIPILSIYGDHDPLRPITGLENAADGPELSDEPPIATQSTRASVQAFANVAGAKEHGDEPIPVTGPDDGTSASKETWTGPGGAEQVVSYTIHGGGHTWPGWPGPDPNQVGPTSEQLDATKTILDFFHDARP